MDFNRFEEGGLPEIEYKDIYCAMSISGVPKPVWRAMQLLHTYTPYARGRYATPGGAEQPDRPHGSRQFTSADETHTESE